MLVFVYGTLKRGHGNNRLLANSTLISEGVTTDKFNMYDGGFPYVSSGCEEAIEDLGHIKGELYYVDEETFARLDMLEGYPSHYTRKEVEVNKSGMDDDVVDAFMYLASDRTRQYLDNRQPMTPNEVGVLSW